MTIDQAFQSGLRHQHAGRLAEAESAYRQILALRPNHSETLHMFGVLAYQVRRYELAVALITRAIAISPNQSGYYSDLGTAWYFQLNYDEAIAAYRRAQALAPDQPQVYYNLGIGLAGAGRTDEAVACYKQALVLNPRYFEVHNNLGLALRGTGRLEEEIACYRSALTYNPNYGLAHNNLALALTDAGQLEEAIVSYRRAAELMPEFATIHANLIPILDIHPECGGAMAQEEKRIWNRRFVAPLRKFIRPHENDPSPGRRLRIGYVSPDFRWHPVACFVTPLFKYHDADAFEVHVYSTTRMADSVSERLRGLVEPCGEWHDVRTLNDDELAEQIRRDGVDILVDLAMHTANNSLLAFARKPAPVLASWLAYPGTTGVETIDWRISDCHMEPPESETESGGELAVRLPDSWCCYEPLSEVEPSPVRTEHWGRHVCFGSLNQPRKINEPTLRLWARVMAEVPDSRLLLASMEGVHRDIVREMLRGMGVASERVEFVRRVLPAEYFRIHDRIDIALDPLPHNGMTTTCDALWMGVPVISLTGDRAAGRAGLSLLTTVGLSELATHTPEDFVRVAVSLAHDLPRLEQLRAGLRERMRASPLMDGPRFTRNLEAAYRTMWQKWCATRGAHT